MSILENEDDESGPKENQIAAERTYYFSTFEDLCDSLQHGFLFLTSNHVWKFMSVANTWGMSFACEVFVLNIQISHTYPIKNQKDTFFETLHLSIWKSPIVFGYPFFGPAKESLLSKVVCLCVSEKRAYGSQPRCFIPWTTLLFSARSIMVDDIELLDAWNDEPHEKVAIKLLYHQTDDSRNGSDTERLRQRLHYRGHEKRRGYTVPPVTKPPLLEVSERIELEIALGFFFEQTAYDLGCSETFSNQAMTFHCRKRKKNIPLFYSFF